MRKIYRCGIIGLGRQGAGIPEPYPVEKPRSHKEAYEMHPRCKLVRGSDLFRSFTESESDLLAPIDIWSICTPADNHLLAIETMLSPSKPLAIFCEKPLAPTLLECDEIISLCKQAQVVLAVNHQRAWEEHGEVVYAGDALETGTHAAELALRHGMSLRRMGPNERGKYVDIRLAGFGPGVSLKAIDDIIRCIEHGGKPKCRGEDGRRAVALALAVDFEGGTSGGETRGRSEVLAEAERVSPAV